MKQLQTKQRKDKLEPLNAVIQVCPDCGKIDVYKDDGHECNPVFREYLEEERDRFYKD